MHAQISHCCQPEWSYSALLERQEWTWGWQGYQMPAMKCHLGLTFSHVHHEWPCTLGNKPKPHLGWAAQSFVKLDPQACQTASRLFPTPAFSPHPSLLLPASCSGGREPNSEHLLRILTEGLPWQQQWAGVLGHFLWCHSNTSHPNQLGFGVQMRP